jgi:hypothetical protein
MRTGKAAFERQMRVSAILTKRIGGQSLREIGEAEGVSPQAIHAMVKRVLGGVVTESVEQARALELLRLDEIMNGGVWQRAKDGDLGAIDRVLKIMERRARLLGLDIQPSFVHDGDGVEIDEAGRPRLRVTIENSPEPARLRWLEDQVARHGVINDDEPKGPLN